MTVLNMEKDKTVTAGDLVILGGKIQEDLFRGLIKASSMGLDLFICEFTDKYVMDSIGDTHDEELFLIKLEGYGCLEYLERMRLFGPGGDWDIRRNGMEYNWRYIGPRESGYFAGIKQYLQEHELKAEDFWEKSRISYLHEHQTELILWGKNQGKRIYYQDKVAAGNLNYPLDSQSSRVRLKVRYYTHKGRQQFSWYLGLEGWE